MNSEQFIFALVNANGACRALLGTTPMLFFPGGIVPNDVDVTGKVYATFQVISGDPANTFETSARAQRDRIQVDSYGLENDKDGARALSAAIRVAVEDEAAQLAADPNGGSSAQTIDDGMSDYQDDVKRWRHMTDFAIWVAR